MILNRVGAREWRRYKTPLAIVANTGFDAFTQQNAPYCAALRYLEKDGASNVRLGALMAAVLPILDGRAPRTTDAVLYYSPRAQAALHKAKPHLYRAAVPRWSIHPDVERVFPVGLVAGDDFAFFRYREAVA